MKIVMVMVSSINGKTTKGNTSNIYEWSSQEDRDYFFDLIDKNNLIIMGANTYNGVKSYINLRPDKLRVVLTRTPEEYKKHTVSGSLEFTSETPIELTSRLSKTYKQALLVGGATTNASFLKARLVDEVYITIEPKIFGHGKGLSSDGEYEARLRLEGIRKLNKNGTLLLKYKVIK